MLLHVLAPLHFMLAAQQNGELLKGLTAVGRGNAITAMARQPESAGMVRTTMFLGIAFTEALALFGFVLAFIISG